MKIKDTKTLDKAIEHNEERHFFSKLAEEAAELSAAAAQHLNKSKDLEDLVDELGDTYIRMEMIVTHFGLEKGVRERIEKKMKKMKLNLKLDKYKNV